MKLDARLRSEVFRQFIMSEADCYFFYREDKIIEKNYFIEDPVSIKDDEEYLIY